MIHEDMQTLLELICKNKIKSSHKDRSGNALLGSYSSRNVQPKFLLFEMNLAYLFDSESWISVMQIA